MRAIPVFILITILVVLVSCSSPELSPTPDIPSTHINLEEQMNTNLKITNVELDKSFYRPGEPVALTVKLQNAGDNPCNGKLNVVIFHLTEVVDEYSKELLGIDEEAELNFSFTPKELSPRGFGIEIFVEDSGGEVADKESSAFDVLDHWTQSPRYGFLSDFPPGITDNEETITILNRYHINALQFYDWMYRHEQSLTADEPYTDLLDRELSLESVNRLITSAHQRNMAAMPYAAVYGASLEFYSQHPDWAHLKANGEPEYFGPDYLVIMDIRPGSPWVAHMMKEFDLILEHTDFDGIHLDQYGDPKVGYNKDGTKYSLEEPLANFINETKVHVLKQREDGAVVFNAVTSWPIEYVAPADQDLVYIEVWPPHIWFDDLNKLIVQAQKLGHGKSVVMAAYINPQDIHNILLADAVIFASGGGHIELGEENALLADPYFPDYGPVSEELSPILHRYYDFTVRYQDVIGPRTTDAMMEYSGKVFVKRLDTGEVINTAANAVKNKVWPIVRAGEGFTTISLINMLGLDDPEWKKSIESSPTELGLLEVRIEDVEKEVLNVWFASPDGDDLSGKQVQFKKENNTLVVELPSLFYWDMIVIEWVK